MRLFVNTIKLIGILLILSSTCFGANEGKELFKENCASCHEIGRILTGPDLQGVNSNRTRDWLISFITDSKKMIAEGDPIAVSLYNEYKKVEMPPAGLNPNEIISILDYIEHYEFVKPAHKDYEAPETKTQNYLPSASLIVLVFLILVLVIFLTFYPAIRKRLPVSFYIISILFFGISLSISASVNITKNRDRIPLEARQTVDFNHNLHVNEYQIDCVYCHEKALNNKTANLPLISNCMKCHDYIREGESYGKDEISKLFKLLDEKREVNWLKGYRLSEHVHFDHGLHTKSAGLSCRDCHENIENPMITKSTVAMKWCIDCHHNQSVNLSLNYYKNVYDTIYYRSGLNSSNNGGSNCSACHY